MKNIYFVGHMGSGKTQIASLLADRLRLKRRDTDEAVEYMFDKSVKEIFEQDGENQFRMFETAAIYQTTLVENLVVSTGGGALSRQKNANIIKQYGYVVYLRMNIDTHIGRLTQPKEIDKRPVLQGGDNLRERLLHLHETRNAAYEFYADLIVDVDHKSADEIVEEICRALTQAGLNPTRI